jgi:hypothetical protein
MNSTTPFHESTILPEFVVGGIGPTLALPFLLGKSSLASYEYCRWRRNNELSGMAEALDLMNQLKAKNSTTPFHESTILPEFVVGGIGPTLALPFLLGKTRAHWPHMNTAAGDEITN